MVFWDFKIDKKYKYIVIIIQPKSDLRKKSKVQRQWERRNTKRQLVSKGLRKMKYMLYAQPSFRLPYLEIIYQLPWKITVMTNKKKMIDIYKNYYGKTDAMLKHSSLCTRHRNPTFKTLPSITLFMALLT